jgi:hypothetical protein
MSEINTNNPGLDFFNLLPPSPAGDSYTDLVTNIKGEPLGRASAVANLSIYFGYSDKDTAGNALDEVISLGSQLNLAILSNLTSDTAIQTYLNTLDPTMPTLPPIKAFLLIAERSLQQGKIGGFQLAFIESKNHVQGKEELLRELILNDDDTTTKKSKKEGSGKIGNTSTFKNSEEEEEKANLGLGNIQTTSETSDQNPNNSGYGYTPLSDNLKGHINTQAAISNDNSKIIEEGRANVVANESHYIANLGKATGGNPWLTGNAYTLFLGEFMEMQRTLMFNKIVQGKVELISMKMIVEIARTTADIIMDIAKINQMIHIVTAVIAGVALVLSIGGLAYGTIGQIKGDLMALDRGTMVGQMGASLEHMSTAITQAATDIEIAELEGLKEILQTYQQLQQHILQKAGEAFKASEDQIQELLQTLDKIRDGLQQAINSALHK